jgi:hypothetical protein
LIRDRLDNDKGVDHYYLVYTLRDTHATTTTTTRIKKRKKQDLELPIELN